MLKRSDAGQGAQVKGNVQMMNCNLGDSRAFQSLPADTIK